MKKIFLPLTFIALIIATFLFAFSPKTTESVNKTTENTNIDAEPQNIVWLTNYKEAVKKAKKEKKRLLLNFTGSDWCGWCIRLDKEVFKKTDFVTYANKNLVCVKLDFPRKKVLPQAEQNQNNELQSKYNIEGYPSILILDSSEKVLLTTGYVEGGSKNYIEHIESGSKK